MEKFAFDYSGLQKTIDQKKAYRLNDVRDRIKKVAFDVVRFMDGSDIEGLWQIQGDGDDQFIVAMYEETPKKLASTKWSAVMDGARNVHVMYGQLPITRIATADFGIPASDAHMVCSFLPNKLATDQDFLRKFVNQLNPAERELLGSAAPDLISSL